MRFNVKKYKIHPRKFLFTHHANFIHYQFYLHILLSWVGQDQIHIWHDARKAAVKKKTKYMLFGILRNTEKNIKKKQLFINKNFKG